MKKEDISIEEITMIKTWERTTKNGKYEVSIRIDPEINLITWINCTCRDFEMRRIKSVNQGMDIKYYALPCKHLKPIIDYYEREHNLKLKIPEQMQGTKKCTTELRNKILKRANNICENCKKQTGTHVHRKIRGNNGGLYNEINCVLLCDECHKSIHATEFL